MAVGTATVPTSVGTIGRSACPRLRRLGDRLPVALVTVVLAGQVLLPGGWSSHSGLLIAAAVLCGLPHGAVDHLIPAWTSARSLSLPRLLPLVAGYAAAAGLAYVALRAAPLPGLIGFLLLSLLHFGAGELTYHQLRNIPPPGGGRARSPLSSIGPVVAWGGTAVLLPLIRWPAQVAPVLDSIAAGAHALLTPALRLAVAALVLGCSTVVVARAAAHRCWRPAAELGLLTGLVLVVPPLPAFAAYFAGWHSLRHMLRLIAADPANTADLTAGRLRRPLRRFAVAAALPTLAAAAALALLWNTAGSPNQFLANDLMLLAALTVPHMAVVAWLDHRTAGADAPLTGTA